MKRIITYILLLLTVFTAASTASACKDKKEPFDDLNIVVTEDTYKNEISQTLSAFGEPSVKEFKDKDLSHVTPGQKYCALFYLHEEVMDTASVEISGDITVTVVTAYNSESDTLLVSNIFENQCSIYNNFDGKKKQMDFFVLIFFTVNGFESSEFNIKIELGASYTPNTFTCTRSISNDKQINAAATVSFLKAEDYTAEGFDSKLKESVEVAPGERFYAVIDYKFSSPVSFTETDSVTVGITVPYGIQAGVEEFPTSDYVKENEIIKATVKNLSNIEGEKQVRFIIYLSTEAIEGEFRIETDIFGENITFYGSKETYSDFKVNNALELKTDLEFSLSGDGSYYTVSGVGTKLNSIITIPETHDGKPVREIKDELFANLPFITEVRLPSTLTKIGASAFKNCTALKSVVIPDSVTDIGADAFSGCKNLSILTSEASKKAGWNASWISDEVSVGWGTRFTLADDGKSYVINEVKSLRRYSLVIPAKYNGLPVTEIAAAAFTNLTNLERVTIPATIKKIGTNAFNIYKDLTSDTRLNEVHISDLAAWCRTDFSSVSEYSNPLCLGGNLYIGDNLVTHLVLPEGLDRVEAYAFLGCTSIVSVTVPSTLQYTSYDAFKDCLKLVEIYNLSEHSASLSGANPLVVHSSAEEKSCLSVDKDGFILFENGEVRYLMGYIGDEKNITLPDNIGGKNYKIHTYAFAKNRTISSVIIPSGVTEIEPLAFYKAIIGSVTLPNTLITIGRASFMGTNLKSVVIPDSVKTIAASVFDNCDSLETVVIGSGVTSIELRAFYDCGKLKTVTFTDTSGWQSDDKALDVTAPTENANLLTNGFYTALTKK